MKINDLKRQLNRYDISYTDEQVSLLDKFMQSVLETNEKFNLTAIKDHDAFVEKMIFDSALVLYDTDLSNKIVIDVGTGAGFPGMVLKILSPETKMTLLDSTKKKIDYLLDFSKANGIDVKGISCRVEDYARNNRNIFDYATARAVASLNILLEIIVPLLKVGGTFIAMKGPGYEDEINQSKNALAKLNCVISQIYEFDLPESNERRAIIHIKKIKDTPKKYPRDYSDIKRLPL